MFRTATAMVGIASALALGAGPVSAQDSVSSREIRLETARQHMKSACQPLEAHRQYEKAYRCYSDVTAFLSDPNIVEIGLGPIRPIRVATARIDLTASVASIRQQRSASSLLASNHILLGVGY